MALRQTRARSPLTVPLGDVIELGDALFSIETDKVRFKSTQNIAWILLELV